MEKNQTIDAVNVRYSELSEKACCLSCGGAANYSNPQKGEVCVDLGSGKGLDALKLAEKVGPSGHVYGIDVSDGMLEKAKKNAEKLGVENVSFQKAELENLPLEDATVDLIISNCTLNHAADKQRVWDEMHRILKEGGRFSISDIYSIKPVPEKYRTDPQAVAECWAGSATKGEFLSHLLNAGFEDIEVIEESDPYEKGEIEVVSWTICGVKPSGNNCGSCCCG